MEKKQNKQEGNLYDKIVKENIESIIPALMNSVLGFKVAKSEVIREKLQQTKEKEADALRIITDPNGQKFILHLEFQVDDYTKMAFRMADYWILLKSKYQLPIRQFVIFIGNGEPKMKTVLADDGNYFQFSIINITQFNYLRFLNSNNPEEIILAVLSDFGKEKPENALNQIIQRLSETKTDQTSFQKYLRQLRVLSKLRKLDLKFDDMIQNMAKYIDEDNDYLVIKAKSKIVENLIRIGKLSLKEIADTASVTIDFVIGIQQKLSADK